VPESAHQQWLDGGSESTIARYKTAANGAAALGHMRELEMMMLGKEGEMA
jgi:hypothetical protein